MLTAIIRQQIEQRTKWEARQDAFLFSVMFFASLKLIYAHALLFNGACMYWVCSRCFGERTKDEAKLDVFHYLSDILWRFCLFRVDIFMKMGPTCTWCHVKLRYFYARGLSKFLRRNEHITDQVSWSVSSGQEKKNYSGILIWEHFCKLSSAQSTDSNKRIGTTY